MKILITGGAGFIGSHVADQYINEGHRVIIVDNLSTGKKENVNRKAKFVQIDINSKEFYNLVKKEKPEVINHHAAQIDLRFSVNNPIQDAKINILGLLNLMEVSKKTKSMKKIIFASTGGAIYGDAEKVPTPETYSAWPVSPYGVAKLSSEHYLYYYQASYGIKNVCLRYGNVYGPRQNPHGEAGVIAIFSEKMINNQEVVINGNGKQTRDFVFVEDVAKANLKALNKNITGIYNIGTGIETNINTIYSELVKTTNYLGKAKYKPAKKGEQQRSALDCHKAFKNLHWKAKVKLTDGLAKTVDSFKK